MSREIGSEFCKIEHEKVDRKYFLSGRTALDYIIKDIKKIHKVKSALLPSYCCHTMIEPFIRNGIEVRLYDVFPDENSGIHVCIPEAQEEEIFYDVLYFGYADRKGFNKEKIRNQWDILIEDQTHSWLSLYESVLADYNFISYRKWSGFTGIAVAKKHGNIFLEQCMDNTNENYCRLRALAVSMKEQYLAGIDIEKEAYLSLFHQAEELLETDYMGYRPSVEDFEKLMNLDTFFLKERRRENARILIDGLKEISELNVLYPNIREGDVPLFVPILVKEKRDELRKYLIQHDVYCPVHWPMSKWHKELSKRGQVLYAQELSLVCDQRYGTEDMTRIIELIGNYFS